MNMAQLFEIDQGVDKQKMLNRLYLLYLEAF